VWIIFACFFVLIFSLSLGNLDWTILKNTYDFILGMRRLVTAWVQLRMHNRTAVGVWTGWWEPAGKYSFDPQEQGNESFRGASVSHGKQADKTHGKNMRTHMHFESIILQLRVHPRAEFWGAENGQGWKSFPLWSTLQMLSGWFFLYRWLVSIWQIT
jgi:hypothetical protein